jgi:hypothetical protein
MEHKQPDSMEQELFSLKAASSFRIHFTLPYGRRKNSNTCLEVAPSSEELAGPQVHFRSINIVEESFTI